ncbi:MAG: hypothetical protein IE909_15980, partial [Campylobacterales bacterium]|nr:hypothetical protein [Campylobacterales bacterium]
MPRKILTVNECYSDNIGDQAIAHAMKRFCTLNADDDVDTCDFSFRNKLEESGRISSNKKTNWKRLIPVFIKKTFFAIKNVQKARNLAHKKYDLAIIGG